MNPQQAPGLPDTTAPHISRPPVPPPTPAGNGDQAQVKFNNFFGHYFLQSVSLPGKDAREVKITKAQAEQTLAKLNLMPAEHATTVK